MNRFAFLFLFGLVQVRAQSQVLTVDSIMRDPRWIGTQPSGIFWDAEGENLCFNWNPDRNPADSLYAFNLSTRTIRAVGPGSDRLRARSAALHDAGRTRAVYEWQGDIFLIRPGKSDLRLTRTLEPESEPALLTGGRVAFRRGNNLFIWEAREGTLRQITDIRPGPAPAPPRREFPSDSLIRKAEAVLFRMPERKASTTARPEPGDSLRILYLDGWNLSRLEISPGGEAVFLRMDRPADARPTGVPSYVNAGGYTEMLPARDKAGHPGRQSRTWIWDRLRDTLLLPDDLPLPGRTDRFPFAGEYFTSGRRSIRTGEVYWNPSGNRAVFESYSLDNKDRWLSLYTPGDNHFLNLERLTDSAWIGGPGAEGNVLWTDDQTVLFASEESGFAHLYIRQVTSGIRKALTTGSFEIRTFFADPRTGWVYCTASPDHPGIDGVYRFHPARPGSWTGIGFSTGGHELFPSPGFRYLALRHSTAAQPWELWYMPAGGKAADLRPVTEKARSKAFRTYPWRTPDFITFPARDGARVQARLYRPAKDKKNGAAVLFVHGAGYLQNAHQHWSHYYREYFFHNLLADKGYTVLDIDYRGSAGYGRGWRTGIYRHMGGKDLEDYLDGLAWLQKTEQLDTGRAGIYGGSYGGFLTLMAMFTSPRTFRAGAALRSVTDWAHYNHGYTTNILNTPLSDTLAYRRSSPLYFAEGLAGHLLICHGMEDRNVHFQDVVRLTQRLIELGKDNWEMAVYPVEDHAFQGPSSWTDEYRRILRLFDRHLLR